MSENGTNGSKATPSRDEVIRLSTYYAAAEGYFDTSEAAQKSGILTISVMDMSHYGPLSEGATHRFYVMVNRTGWMVTRYSDNRYEVTPHDQTEDQRQERELRGAVLDAALWQMTGEGAGYHPDPRPQERPKARAAMIKELLADRPEDEGETEREATDPQPHAVVRDVLPDLTVSLAPGPEGGPGPQPLRQWSIEIGPYYSCEVALFGYDEDGSPVLVPLDTEPDGEESDYEEDEEE